VASPEQFSISATFTPGNAAPMPPTNSSYSCAVNRRDNPTTNVSPGASTVAVS